MDTIDGKALAEALVGRGFSVTAVSHLLQIEPDTIKNWIPKAANQEMTSEDVGRESPE